MTKLILYLILRSDLISELKWPLGAVFTQVAHAATQIIWTFRDDPDVIAYMKDMENMHKVTLRVDNEEVLIAESIKLKNSNIDHRVWIEDNMPVAIAIKPMERELIKPHLKHLSLYK